MHRVLFLRFDFYVSLLLAGLLAWGAVWLVERTVITPMYQGYLEENAVSDGQVGGRALDGTPRARSVADLQSGDFTLEVDILDYLNLGGMVAGDVYWKIVELPDGERVAAQINATSVQEIPTGPADPSASAYDSTSLLPVGRVVNEPLSEEAVAALAQVGGVTQTGVTIDMGRPVATEQAYGESINIVTYLAALVLGFLLVHGIGAKLGLFPRLRPEKYKAITGVDSECSTKP